MAEWTAQINFNYSSSYQAYAYSLMYQPGVEQNQVNLSSWSEPGDADLCNNYTPTQGFYAPAAAGPKSPEEQSPQSPVCNPYNSGVGQYQSTGMMYLGDTEAGRLLMTVQPGENEGLRTGSDSASDSEPLTSPDSWSSGSSCIPLADPATWALKTDLDDETSSRSPDSTEEHPIIKEEPQPYCIIGTASNCSTIGSENATVNAPKTQSTNKGKVRAAFSEAQMNILTQRFNMQRYLTPAEMKSMAELTGLTYKQVKTWFQNRRMKLRRHQKDNSWASERYTLNKDNVGHGTAFTNLSSHIQPYQGQARPAFKEHYNPRVIEAALKKPAPQNLALYLAAVGGANGSAGYPSWPTNTAQAPGWPQTPNVPQFGYSARFNSQGLCSPPDTGFKEGDQVNRAPHNPIMQGSAQ